MIKGSKPIHKAKGACCGFIGTGGDWEGKDYYDLIDWIARQYWCDGNVGMVGISYLGSLQILAAAEQTPL